MKLSIISRDIKVTEGMKEYLNIKFDFLNKFLKENDKVDLKLSVSKNIKTIEVLIDYNNQLIKVSGKSEDYYETVDIVTNIIKNKINKIHDIIIDKKRNKDIYKEEYIVDDKEDYEPKIVKRKSFNIKPMSESEAILQMNLLGHQSFMFVNSDLDFIVCLLYKRKDGNYGLIQSIME